jgi:proline iminopeptidase
MAMLGHSGHSILALAYAARFPERTSQVILVGGMPAFYPGLGQRIAAFWDVVASPERKRLPAETVHGWTTRC